MKPIAFDSVQARARKEAYFQFARSQARRVFKPDGTYQPATEEDPRIPYWMYPALVSSPDPIEHEFANVIYGAARMWNDWDVFTTSSVAADLARERRHMTPELIQRSEEHLARFLVRDDGRSPCSGANDYVFHGYNDNMPAMSVRALILGGEALGRKDLTDHGRFFLEGLCAPFERRGLLSEYSSGTYSAITLTALMEVAECSVHREAREMAQACSNRILLDIFGHWHQHVGGIGGAQSRAYTADKQQWLSVMNALMWYLTASPLCVNPIEALSNPNAFAGYIHHGRNFAFNLAQFAEGMAPSYVVCSDADSGKLRPPTVFAGVAEFCAAPRPYPYEIHATTDSGQAGLFGGVKEIQTRSFHQPLYGVGSASVSWFDQAGQQLALHAVLSARSNPQSWQDRVGIRHATLAGTIDHGDMEKCNDQEAVEVGHVTDVGHYHVLQKRGSALVLGALAPAAIGKEISQLKFSLLFNTFIHQPDETAEEGKWQFFRFGDVYVGVRMSAMVEEQRQTPRRVVKNRYLRVEVPLIEGRTVKVTHEFRERCDFGYAFEIASRAECGSFAEFCRQCLACTWEFYHCFYRTSRYCGRHGELQIIDSVAAGTVRFMSVDGVVEPKIKFAATGLDPKLTQLFPDGRRIRQRRLVYRPDFIGSPFYKVRQHILETDLPATA